MPQIVTPNTLKEIDRERAQKLQRATEVQGVLVGAMTTEFPWHLQPLFLHKSELTLIRTFEPSISSNERLRSILSRLIKRSDTTVLAHGVFENQHWYQRRFVKRTLGDHSLGGDQWIELSPRLLLIELAMLLKSFHSDGIIHGHVTLENVGVEQSRVFLLDTSFRCFCPKLLSSSSHLAPEIVRGEAATEASDVFGLANIISHFVGADELASEERTLIERAKSSNASSRPELLELLELCSRVADKEQALARTSGKSAYASGESESLAPPADSFSWAKGTVVLSPEVIQEIREAAGSVEAPNLLAVGSSAPESATKVPHLERTMLSDEFAALAESTRGEQFGGKSSRPTPAYTSRGARRSGWVDRHGYSVFLAILLGVSLGLFLYQKGYLRSIFRSAPGPLETPQLYQEYWSSGLQSKMEEVARRAVLSDDDQAELVIVRDALQGKPRAGVYSSLLRTVFDPRWEGELTDEDRKSALSLALAPLLADELEGGPRFNERHPSLLLGFISQLRVDDDGRALRSVPISKLYSLGEPYESGLKGLEMLGVKDLGDRSARSLLQLLTTGVTAPRLAAYLIGDDKGENSLKRLVLLNLLEDQGKDFWTLVYKVGEKLPDVGLGKVVHWFESDKSGLWKSTTPFDRLRIAQGVLPKDLMNFSRYADLLAFPSDEIRKLAGSELKSKFFVKDKTETFTVLAAPDSKFDRRSVNAFVKLLSLDLPSQHRAALKWYQLKPDPSTVLRLLLARNGSVADDPLAVEGARYLKEYKSELDLAQLKELVNHSEVLLRALAYSTLNAEEPGERAILQKAILREENPGLRKALERKLQ